MPQLSIMIKPASSACNLRCKYCFYHSLAKSRECADFGVMQETTVQNIIKKSLDFADGQSIYFAFQGGEPLIAGRLYFENFVNIVRKFNINKSKIFFSLQTNGTMIDNDFAKFFKENNFLIGLSLDGDQNGNRFRVDSHLDYTFVKVLESAKLLQSCEVDFNILTVTTGYTADHINDIYKFFKQNGFNHLQFIPCLRPNNFDGDNELFMSTEQYTKFLITLFNHYVKDYVRGNYTSIRTFDNMVNLYLGNAVEQCGVKGYCSHQFVFEGDGSAYPCDFYCSDEWLLGNINDLNFDQLAHSNRTVQFIKESFDIPKKCLDCNILGLCRAGGCKRCRNDKDYCQSFQLFFKSCLPLFSVFKNKKQPT